VAVVEAVSLILGALAAGALAGAEKTAGEAVKDAYAGLKALVARLVKDRAAAQTALVAYEDNPQVCGAALEAELVAVDAGGDEQVVAAAQRVMALADPAGSNAGKYVVDVRGGQGVQVGDHNTQTNTFTPPSSAPPLTR